MPEALISSECATVYNLPREVADKIYSALLSACTSVALVVNTAFQESFTSSHLMVVLVILLSLHALSRPRLLFCREFVLYSVFVGYLFVLLLWTPDIFLARNTLFPVVDFMLILLLCGSLFMFHDERAVLGGMLAGFLIGAGLYTYAGGFPFTYPRDFSYNAMASMYLFGLFVTLAFGWATRLKALSWSLALVLLFHIAATTSIKTNLGILFGAVVTGAIYFRQSFQVLRENAAYLLIGAMVLVYIFATNEAVVERFQAGVDRISLGLSVLQAREDIAGYGGYEARQFWMEQGLQGWPENPVFGHGVEAFRANHGTTSHSTPIDLLYNTGVIGFTLFYAIFGSMIWRLFVGRDPRERILRALVLATLCCNLSMTLSGTLFYQTFLAAFIGMSAVLLRGSSRSNVAFAMSLK